MKPRPIPTAWNQFNLAGSPFFQESLENGDQTPRPLSLFVGREPQLGQLLSVLYGAGLNSSRQAVSGAAGVGKTTLVKEFKAKALEQGYLTTDDLVPLLTGDTADKLFGRVLGMLYDTILANHPATGHHPAMRQGQVLVRTARLGTGGVSLSLLGIGAGVTKGTTVTTPSDLLIDGPRVMRDLMRMVQESDARGVLLHLNNIENLSESDAVAAAAILRDLRDLMLLHSGLHFVIDGTTDAVNTIVGSHAQIRSIVANVPLEPMAVVEVHLLLQARYEHMRVDQTLPVVSPVDALAVETLYELFRGDLRGLFKTLEDGVTPLIGLVGDVTRPIRIDELRPVVQQRYAAELAALPERNRVEQLRRWSSTGVDSSQTQKSLAKLWKVSQPAVSQALGYLVRQGYVYALPRSGAGAGEYVLSGVGRLIFG